MAGRRILVVAFAVLGCAALVPFAAPSTLPFRAEVTPIPPTLRAAMTGRSWRPGCPVGLAELRLVRVAHWRFDGRVGTGRLVVHHDVAATLVDVFRHLYRDGFPIRRMVPVDAYGADDYRSIEADNTSVFNCRFVDGTKRWSEHAFGKAIDLNPIENPYVGSSGKTSHRASVPYLERTPYRAGMAVAGGVLVRAFEAAGWGWGGRWSGAQDYQHFSASGR